MNKRWMGVLLAGFLLAGCNDFLAERMVAPPNGGAGAGKLAALPGERAVRIAVGPPDASIAAWVREPATGEARGTVLLLHGFLNCHSQLEGPARNLTDAGYRTVSVDLRGHGQSTGEHITYGADDAKDLVQVMDYLQSAHLCGGKVGVMGVSYGAASAILFAGADSRVAAVVAVAPFDTLRAEAPYFGKHLLPVPGLFMSEADYREVVDRMGKVAEFNPDAPTPLSAIQKSAAHVRLFHGDMDMIIPCACSERLAAAAPGRTELTILRGQGHLEASFDPFGELYGGTREWFDRYLGGAKGGGADAGGMTGETTASAVRGE